VEINYPNDDSATSAPRRSAVCPQTIPAPKRCSRRTAEAVRNIEPKLNVCKIVMKTQLAAGSGRNPHQTTTRLPQRPKPLPPTRRPHRPKPTRKSSLNWVKLQSNTEALNLHVTAAHV
jgi:hypothetical protein